MHSLSFASQPLLPRFQLLVPQITIIQHIRKSRNKSYLPVPVSLFLSPPREKWKLPSVLPNLTPWQEKSLWETFQLKEKKEKKNTRVPPGVSFFFSLDMQIRKKGVKETPGVSPLERTIRRVARKRERERERRISTPEEKHVAASSTVFPARCIKRRR